MEYAAEDRKSYRAEITFGVKTDTGDDSGTVTERSSLPACSKEDFSSLLAEFTGRQKQLPPMYSALKLNGQPLYKLARKGISVERQEREIFIYRLQLLSFRRKKRCWMLNVPKGHTSERFWKIYAQNLAFAVQ